MKSLILITCQSEAKRRIRAKKRQMIARAFARYAIRLTTLTFAWIGVVAVTAPYSALAVAIITASLATFPMFWAMEEDMI